ncbi:hypothetical protein Mapa_004236 [Marchantia paleacea]|nr:hypothetical protein Mapa_004236 [Marchantia paleacea]
MFDFLDYQFNTREQHSSPSSSSSSPPHRDASASASPSRPFLTPAGSHCACADCCVNMEASNLDENRSSPSVRFVLCFQHKLGEVMIARWIEEYNARTGRKLKWSEALPNALHMMEIEDDNPGYVLEQLMAESPLESIGTFAAVNRYNSTFLSEKPKSLRQIVTVLISNQFLFNQLVFNLADLILAPVGKVVGKQFRKHRKGTRIEAVVETCSDSFVTEIEVPLLDTQTLLLELDYVGLPSGCHNRSLFHKAKDCLNSLKPKKKSSPSCGSCFQKDKQCISIDC